MKTPEEWACAIAEEVNRRSILETEIVVLKNVRLLIQETREQAYQEERERLLRLATQDCPHAVILGWVRKSLDDPESGEKTFLRSLARELVEIIEWAQARLAHMANDNGYAEGWRDRVTFGNPMPLREIRSGALFLREDGEVFLACRTWASNRAGGEPCREVVRLSTGGIRSLPDSEMVREVVIRELTQ